MSPTNPWLIALLLFGAGPVFAQTDTAGEMQNLYFIEKGQRLVSRPDDYVPDTCGFYIYRNAEYSFILGDWNWITCRIRDIRHDSLYVALYDAGREEWVDRVYPPGELRAMRLPTSPMRLIVRFSLDDYQAVFERTTRPKRFDLPPRITFSRDSVVLIEEPQIAVITQTGIDTLIGRGISRLNSARVKHFEELAAKEKRRIRRGLWFTPSGATDIRGVCVGLISGKLSVEHRRFVLKGLNLNADVATALMAPAVVLLTIYADRLSNMQDWVGPEGEMGLIKGVSVSAGGVAMNCDLRGFSVNGGMCLATQVRGVVVSGIENVQDFCHGVQISGLYNRSAVGRGVQIGVLNVSKHFHGIQIGLWNFNGKRSLPIVNWDFERVKN